MQAKDNDLADPPRESIRLEQDINRPVSERLDSKFSPIGVDDGDFRGRKRTWKTPVAPREPAPARSLPRPYLPPDCDHQSTVER